MIIRFFLLFLIFACTFCSSDEPTKDPDPLSVVSFKIDDVENLGHAKITDVDRTATFEITFSAPIDPVYATLEFVDISGSQPLAFELSDDQTKLVVTPTQPLAHLTRHLFWVSMDVKGTRGETLGAQFSQYFYTELDPTPKRPVLPNDEDSDNDNTNDLLSVVQQQTFKYFWDFAHPASGMARERNTSGNTVTSGGSGFGIMSLIVGIERNFITRTQGVERMDKIVSFLETADRFHGAWPHWIDGSNGDVIPFSTKDNGGDLVETSFLVQGMLTFRQYLEPSDTVGNNLINRINILWEGVEWDWYRKNNENVLYWHWSPNYTWDMNFAMYGYFEEQITYFLAAASPTHSIPKAVYSNGYGKNGGIVKNNIYYTYKLPLESPAPLFWVQYAYLGLDPHFSDEYANYGSRM